MIEMVNLFIIDATSMKTCSLVQITSIRNSEEAYATNLLM